MKNILAILLISVILLPISGTYLFFHFKEIQIKKEVNEFIQNKIEEKDIITLRFSDKEIKTRLVWKHSREFIFEGNMYDIVDQGVDGNITWYRCYRDHKETRLFNEKEKRIARAIGNDPAQKKQSERIKQILKTAFQNKSINWNILLPPPSIILFSIFHFPFSIFPPSPPVPPPECA
ncbi:MAG: hypothetical protein KBC43_00595 [Bacteroidales bacterium]|nr:hypothetical protein [Bacteroidales bacterium]